MIDDYLARWRADLDRYADCTCADCIFQRSAYEAALARKSGEAL